VNNVVARALASLKKMTMMPIKNPVISFTVNAKCPAPHAVDQARSPVHTVRARVLFNPYIHKDAMLDKKKRI
jgi:hypothetical protein